MILQETIRSINQRLRALETREYTEVGTPTACFEQYIEHCDDPDTFINFQPDNIQMDVGGKTALFLDATDTNVFLGADAGAVLDPGGGNVLVGYEAGYALTSGAENIIIGLQTGYSLTTGDWNILIGVEVAYNLTTGIYNTAIGAQAMESCGLDPGFNVAVGEQALRNVGTTSGGDCNTAIGGEALYEMDTGDYNVAVGYAAMFLPVTGRGNIAVGPSALQDGTGGVSGGDYNIGIGLDAMLSGPGTGDDNIAIGRAAASALGFGAGAQNIAVGYRAMYYNRGSSNNIVIGHQAGYGANPTTYDNCVLIGYRAGYLLETGDANVFLGYQAGYNELGANRLYIENSNSVTPLIYGEFDNNLVRVHGTLGVGTAGNYLDISLTGVVTLLGTAKRDLTLRADLDYTTITAQGKPTQVIIGVFHGYSMPIYAADNEELFFNENVPGRWDGASDITFHVLVALELAETADETFKFQFSWNQVGTTDIVPVATHDVTDEITVIDGTQYATYMLEFTIDYDADAGDVIVPHDDLSARLRRIASGGDEVDGEIIVLDWHTHYTVDKMFKAPE